LVSFSVVRIGTVASVPATPKKISSGFAADAVGQRAVNRLESKGREKSASRKITKGSLIFR